MLSTGRPDAAAVRARLQALTPRWVPTASDLATLPSGPDLPDDRLGDDPAARRHSLPDAPRPVWRLDAAAIRGVLSLALAAVAGALVMVIVGWPRGEAVPVDRGATAHRGTANVLSDPSVSASAGTSTGTDATGMVMVDVDGRVQHPGVVELAAGSRVVDAIKAAGGVAPHADTGALNLAEVLIDGQQVVVPDRGSSDPVSVVPGGSGAVASPSAPVGATVSLNSATPEQLETLPGIGPVLAAAIVQWRTDNGGFTTIEQLQDVSGIGPATFADIAPLVRL